MIMTLRSRVLFPVFRLMRVTTKTSFKINWTKQQSSRRRWRQRRDPSRNEIKSKTSSYSPALSFRTFYRVGNRSLIWLSSRRWTRRRLKTCARRKRTQERRTLIRRLSSSSSSCLHHLLLEELRRRKRRDYDLRQFLKMRRTTSLNLQ